MRWETLEKLAGRLVQFGTPNRGSLSMLTVLLGRDRLTRRLGLLAEAFRPKGELLDVVRHYPGVLELLPWPQDDATPDYFTASHWADLAQDYAALVFQLADCRSRHRALADAAGGQ